MNNPKQILWTDTNSMPPHNYLGQKKDGIYVFVNGDGKKSKAFSDKTEEDNNEDNDVPVTEFVKQVFTYLNELDAEQGGGVDMTKVVWPDIYYYQEGANINGVVENNVQFAALMNYVTPLYEDLSTLSEDAIYLINLEQNLYFTQPDLVLATEQMEIDEKTYYKIVVAGNTR